MTGGLVCCGRRVECAAAVWIEGRIGTGGGGIAGADGVI